MKTTSNTVLITGGTSGLGLGFAKEFLRLGNKVIICGRRNERLIMIQAENPGIIIRQCDVSNASQRTDLFNWIKTEHPDVNILLNNAGVQLNTHINAGIDLERLDKEINTNITAPVHLVALFIDFLKTKPVSAIINVSSGLALVPIAFLPVYCATKAAIHSITLSLRHQLKDTTVKVFEIFPPMVDTELGQDRRDNRAETHGGISVEEFIAETMPGIANDVLEIAVGQAKNLYEKREAWFSMMNR